MNEKRKLGCSLLVIIFVILPIIATRFGHSAVVAAKTADRSDACFMSQKFVTQNLKAPTTAQFPDWTEENCITSQAGNHWTVTSFVDAQNGFGALIRSDYTARMTYQPERDGWTLTGLTIDAR